MCKHFRGAANEAAASNPLPAEGNKGSMSVGHTGLKGDEAECWEMLSSGPRVAAALLKREGTHRQSSMWMRPHKAPPIAEVLLVALVGG